MAEKKINAEKLRSAAEMIRNSRHITVFSGAGISVESGIPPFRGKNGLWNKYDPLFLELNYFLNNPEKSWSLIREIFYDFFGKAEPNNAHLFIAELENNDKVKTVITQNIDNLHQQAGSRKVLEFHGTARYLCCLNCGKKYPVTATLIKKIPPRCNSCGNILKPDFIFFGEPISEEVHKRSLLETNKADLFLLVGTSGEVMPACQIPYLAKENGSNIIEVNIENSSYTPRITDIFIKGPAAEVLAELGRLMYKSKRGERSQ